MPKKTFECSKCDRSFKMAGHLARHLSATHGMKTKKKGKTVKKAKRRDKKRAMKKGGRPKGAVSRFGLKTMSLERLTELIDAARGEPRSLLAYLEASIGQSFDSLRGGGVMCPNLERR